MVAERGSVCDRTCKIGTEFSGRDNNKRIKKIFLDLGYCTWQGVKRDSGSVMEM